MTYSEIGFHFDEEEIAQVAAAFNLDTNCLQVEFFRPGHQGIFVETVADRKFRIHLSLEEKRIVSVQQIAGPLTPALDAPDPFAKYKAFMK
ncbi:MAG: hypothetical protein ONB48_07630 [candidate division KSB1 bacterium]|nr:hypothetical protein [candidate division KSB1 bacterium]MDZ7274692.1 hypothetical protein [candidate division KSB1 bacterium]MDZ7285517.1 hypothetical protein [candidate division KSB1 bacterium]MDZ7298549.1 hypothetical protein [candidate division KSB1 bacterium]MDZ7306599.1 hypothetical protein [candidate division KSB1 bacterium]